ncbi:MAG: methyltransferase domain-containing protein [Eubacteriales bacterium]|nr:methyltransferase domain-containing protein [Eubacteriales bacterium]MDD3881022.1 methyltransferase domain-containing protein [Eubacteriales bacterium]MDD4511909.1 methyltransferase domain-containing protein [Eubacteriales bacterium]
MDYSEIIKRAGLRPELYSDSTAAFWDDEHISKGMLEAHLSPDTDAASRKPAFMDASAKWIRSLCEADSPALLDLGCGPGLYAERLTRLGFTVTGVDMSRRSLDYASESAQKNGLNICYVNRDYRRIAFENEFDVCTLIYNDFGVLSPESRHIVLGNARRALKKGGLMILDAYAKPFLYGYSQGRDVSYHDGGFWSDEKYVEIDSRYLYPETGNYLEQSIIITESRCETYNIWNQAFTKETLSAELQAAGFGDFRFFGDVSGSDYSDCGEVMAVVARRL